MLTFLFWNTNKQKKALEIVTELSWDYEVDILMLAESILEPQEILIKLNDRKTLYSFSKGECEKIQIFTRFSHTFVVPLSESKRYTIRRLSLPAREDLILVVAHLSSKMYANVEDQMVDCSTLADEVRRVELVQNHRRTILVGDLNMSPFEQGIVAAHGLNATLSRKVAEKVSREVKGKEYFFFFNPMWKHFGDLEGQIQGSYDYPSSSIISYFWHIFDQVLIRPDLLSFFHSNDVKILTSSKSTSLITKSGLPNKEISDHLPILFKVNI